MASGYSPTTSSFAASGGLEGYHKHINLKPGKYTFSYHYEMYDIPDQLAIHIAGKPWIDTGLVSGSSTGKITTVVKAGQGLDLDLIGGYGTTAWNFDVNWINGTSKPTAEADTAKLDPEDHKAPVKIDILANDHDEDGPLARSSKTITIVDKPLYGTVSVNIDGSVTYHQTSKTEHNDNFTYTVTDADGNVSAPARVSLRRGDCPDPTPITVENKDGLDIIHQGAECIVPAVAMIGRYDGLSDMIGVQRGSVRMMEGQVYAEGVFTLDMDEEYRPFFTGSVLLDGRDFVNGGTVRGKPKVDESQDFLKVAGLNFRPSQIEMGNDHVDVNGRFTLPDLLGSLDIDLLPQVTSLRFDSGGATIAGGALTFPGKQDIKFGESGWKVRFEDAGISYDGVTDALNIKGIMTVTTPIFAKGFDKSGLALKIDMSSPVPAANLPPGATQPTGLVIKDGGVTGLVSFGASNIFIPGWDLTDVKFTFNLVNSHLVDSADGQQAVVVTAKLGPDFAFSYASEPKIVATVGFTTANGFILPDKIGLGVESLKLPIVGTPGFFLQDIYGEISGIAGTGTTNAGFHGTMLISEGPEKLSNLIPEWLNPSGSEFYFSSIELDGKAEMLATNGHEVLDGKLTVTLGSKDFFQISGRSIWDIDGGTFSLNGAVTAVAGGISGEATLTFDHGDVFGTGTIKGKIPNLSEFGLLANREFANARLEFNNKAYDDTNNYFKIVPTITIPEIGSILFSAKFNLNDLFSIPTFRFGQDALKVGSWDAVAGQEWLIMTASWQEALESDAHVRVRYTPDTAHMDQYVEYTRDQFDSATNGIQVLSDFTSDFGVSVLVKTPEAGRWDIYVDDPDLGFVQTDGFKPNIAPTLGINGWGSGGDGHYEMTYTVDDPDGEFMHVRFFADNDGVGFDGFEFGAVDVASGQHTYSFTAPYYGTTPHIYVRVEDGGDDLVQEYAFQAEAQAGSDLEAVRTLPSLNVVDGKLLTYTVTVTNHGTTTAHNVTYLENWQHAHLESISGAQIISGTDTELNLRPLSGPDLDPGQSATFTITLRLDALDDDVIVPPPDDGGGGDDGGGDDGGDGDIASFAAAAVIGGPPSALPSPLTALQLTGRVSSGDYEEDLRNNIVRDELPFLTAGVAKAANGQDTDVRIEHVLHGETGPNGELRYDVVVTNLGKGIAGGVTIVEALAGTDIDGTRLLFPTSDDYQVVSVAESGRIELLLRDLPAGERITIPVQFISPSGDPVKATGTVSHVGQDPDPTNDTAVTTFTPEPGAGLPTDTVDWHFVAAKTSLVPDGDGNVLLDAQLTNSTGYYDLTGPVTLKLTLPEGVTYAGADFTPGYYTALQSVTYGYFGSSGNHLVGTYAYSTVSTVSDDGRTVLIVPPSNQSGGLNNNPDGSSYYGQTSFFLGFKVHVDGTLPKDVKLEVQALSDYDPDSTPGNGVLGEDDTVVFHIDSATNSAPTVANAVPTQTATQHQPFSLTLPQGLFSDADGDALTIAATMLPRWMSYDAATRTLSGTPGAFDISNPNDDSLDKVVLEADDGRGGHASTTFDVLIDDVQDAPIAVKPYEDRIAFVGVPFTYTLPANYVPINAYSETADRSASYFWDPDWTGTAHSFYPNQPYLDPNFKYSVADLPSWLSSPSDGQWDPALPVFSGTPTQAGTYTVTVRGGYNDSDFVGRSGSQTFTIKVVAIEPPVANGPLAYTAHEHEAFSQVVPGAAFTDPNGDPLTLWVTGAPSWLSFDNATRTLSGTPDGASAGTFAVTLHAADGKLGYASLPVTITVDEQNSAPESYLDGYALPIGGSVSVQPVLGVLANDFDADGDPLAAALVSGPSHAASFALNPDGSFTYSAAAGFVGTDSFTYQAADGHGGTASADVLLYVGHAPTGAGDAYAMLEERKLSVNADHGVLANDADADGDALSANLISGPAHGALTLNLDGSFDYTPTTNFHGTDSFSYRLNDGRLSSDPVTVSIDVANLNDRPTASNTIYFGGKLSASGGAVTFSAAEGLLKKATDADGDTLTAIITGQPKGATVTANADGSFSITPAAYTNGTFFFQYVVSDGTAISQTRYAVANIDKPDGFAVSAPIARDDHYTVAAGNTLVTADNRYYGRIDATHAPGLLVNDDQPGWSPFDSGPVGRYSPLFSKLVDGPDHGTLTFQSDYYGVFTYTPDAGFTGSDSFVYEVMNSGSGEKATATATIDVGTALANAKPVAVADTYTIPEDGTLVLTGSGVLGNDTDADGDPLTFILETGPSRGSFSTSPTGQVFFDPYDNVNNENAGSPIVFTYRAYDGHQFSDAATVTINITPKEDPLSNDAIAIFYDERYNGAVQTGRLDAFLYGSEKPTAVTGVEGRADLVGTPIQTRFGTLEIDADGTYRYALGADRAAHVGSFQETISVALGNGLGSVETLLYLNSGFVDDAATAGSVAYTVTKDRTLTVDSEKGLLTAVQDPDGGQAVDETTYQGQGGALEVVASGSFRYTPKAGFVGDDTFQVAVRSGTGSASNETVTFHVVENGNGLPVSGADSFAAVEDRELIVAAASGVLANDADPDGQSLTALLVSNAAHGTVTLSPNGAFTYRPSADFSGSDSFTYRASDGQELGPVTTVTLAVAPVQDVPVATDDGGFSTAFGHPLTIAAATLLANDRDADGDPLTVTGVGAAQHGTVALASGNVVFTPAQGYSGPASFTYTISDSHGGIDTATVSAVVRSPVKAVVRASGDFYQGAPQFVVKVDGVQVGGVQTVTKVHGSGYDDIAIDGVIGPNPHNLTIQMINDLYGGAGQDRNLYVDKVTLNGQVFEAEQAVNTAGPSNATEAALLGSAGKLTFDLQPPTDTLVLRVAGDAYDGDPQFVVKVDGVQVGGLQTASTPHGGGYQTITLHGDFGDNPESVSIQMVNDKYGGPGQDRNLYVDKITLNGTAFEAEHAVNTAGPSSASEAALLNGTGTLTFDLRPPQDTLVLRVSGDSYDGDPLFVVKVNGMQVGGVQTAPIHHGNGYGEVTLQGDFGDNPESVSIQMINDKYSGPGLDRNLYVDKVTLNGVAFEAEHGVNTAGPNSATEAALLNSSGKLTIDLHPDTLVFAVAEDAYNGDARFVVALDGVQIGGPQIVTRHHGDGYENITLLADLGTNPGQISVRLANDAYAGPGQDRNLYVDKLTINGHIHEAELATNTAGPSNAYEAALLNGTGTLVFDHLMI